MPFIVAVSKSDVQDPDGPDDPVMANYEVHKASSESPRSLKWCISLVLRSVIGIKNGEYQAATVPALKHHATGIPSKPLHLLGIERGINLYWAVPSTVVLLIGHCTLSCSVNVADQQVHHRLKINLLSAHAADFVESNR